MERKKIEADSSNLYKSESFEKMIDSLNHFDEDYYQRSEMVPEVLGEKSLRVRDLIKYIKSNIRLILVSIIYFTFFPYLILTILSFIKAFYYIDSDNISIGFEKYFYLLFSFIAFLFSTEFKFYNFHRRKLLFIYLSIFNIVLTLAGLFLKILTFIITPLIMSIKIDEDINVNMVLGLGRMLLVIPTTLFIFFLTKWLYKILFDISTKKIILSFKIALYLDFRSNKKYLYDVAFVQYMKNGKMFNIRMDDRLLHMVVDGTTGTGKTSSTMSIQIVDDLDKKILNEDTLKKQLEKALIKGQLYIDKPIDDADFSIKHFKAKEGYEGILKELSSKYVSCGQTIVAPNASLTDEVYDLCIARKIKCNRVDPIPVEGKNEKKHGFIGYNPLFISPLIPDWDRNRKIIKTATLLSDVLQALYEMKGKGDPYFTGINRSVTTAIAILLQKTYPLLHNGKQPNPNHVRSLVNDFSRITPYLNEFNKLPDKDEFEFVKDLIVNDLLGAGREKMNDHVRGLRTILNEFLSNPLIKDVLCAAETIDMDKMLADGEITVVNYALELGSTDSVAFGLFFVLSFNDAVIRRPGSAKTRLPHYYSIDELPVLLHPQMERCFSLFRQYGVGMVVAIQTLDQLEKTESTKYLKGIIMGCSHHIVFGRSSTTEMELYSKMAGKESQNIIQESVTETSISEDSPNLSYGERSTTSLENIIDETDIRNRAFQEVTVFSVKDGNILKAFHGRVSFMADKKRKAQKRYNVDWKYLYYNHLTSTESDASEELKTKNIFVTDTELLHSSTFKSKATILLKETNKDTVIPPKKQYDNDYICIDEDTELIIKEEENANAEESISFFDL